MAENNKMKDMLVNKLMLQMGIPMIPSMVLQGSAKSSNQMIERYPLFQHFF